MGRMWAVEENPGLRCIEPEASLWKTLPILRRVNLHVEDWVPTDLVTAKVHAIGNTINNTAYLIINGPHAIFFLGRENHVQLDASVVGHQPITVLYIASTSVYVFKCFIYHDSWGSVSYTPHFVLTKSAAPSETTQKICLSQIWQN